MEDTQAQLKHIQTLRILEEEKLHLLKIAQEVEDHKSHLRERQRRQQNGEHDDSGANEPKNTPASRPMGLVDRMESIQSANIKTFNQSLVTSAPNQSDSHNEKPDKSP